MGEEKDARKYNGWANYETWVVRLWLDNEEPSYRYWSGQARAWHGRDGAACGLARQLKDELGEGNPLDGATLYSDLLWAALGEVDWYELAESYLDEIQDDDEGEGGRPDGAAPRRLTLDEIECLPREEFDALPEAERRRYFDAMTRENSPTEWEFYRYDLETAPAEFDSSHEDWTDEADSCDGRPVPEPTPEKQVDAPIIPALGEGVSLLGEVISAYTRRQALSDGVLVDVTETAREAGFRVPMALTRAVWAKYVAVPEGVEAQDEAGRLWDVVWMCRYGAGRAENRAASDVLFHLHVRNDNREGEPPLVTLKAVCGPDDDGRPCVTVMLPDED